MTTTPEQRTKLKAAAEAATPGPWKSYETVVQFNGELPGGFDVFYCPRAKETATFIALANPAAILALITRIEALEARVASAEEMQLPHEPTDAMIEAGEEEIACRKQHGMGVFAGDIYEAMVRAHFQSQGGDHGRD